MKTVTLFDLKDIIKNLRSKLDGYELEEGNKPHRIIQEDMELYFGYEIEFCVFDQRAYIEKLEIYDDNGELMYLERSHGREIEQVIIDYTRNYYKN